MTALPGVYAGIVVSVSDPQGRGRVRLRIPQVSGLAVSGWAEPVSYGTVSPGDQVAVAFEGGDANRPLFWPRSTETYSAWAPLTLAAGWSAGDNPPSWRTTSDGMIELHGLVTTTATPATNTLVPVATLPAGLGPLYPSSQISASNISAAYTARKLYAASAPYVTTTSTTYVDLTGGPSYTFTAPGTGEVLVTVTAWLRSSTATDTAYMSARVLQGSTVISETSDDRAAIVSGTAFASASAQFFWGGLTPGATYTATARYRSATSTGSTATAAERRLVVEPTTPFTSPHARVTVDTSGTISVLYPSGSAGTTVSLSGIRLRAR